MDPARRSFLELIGSATAGMLAWSPFGRTQTKTSGLESVGWDWQQAAERMAAELQVMPPGRVDWSLGAVIKRCYYDGHHSNNWEYFLNVALQKHVEHIMPAELRRHSWITDREYRTLLQEPERKHTYRVILVPAFEFDRFRVNLYEPGAPTALLRKLERDVNELIGELSLDAKVEPSFLTYPLVTVRLFGNMLEYHIKLFAMPQNPLLQVQHDVDLEA